MRAIKNETKVTASSVADSNPTLRRSASDRSDVRSDPQHPSRERHVGQRDRRPRQCERGRPSSATPDSRPPRAVRDPRRTTITADALTNDELDPPYRYRPFGRPSVSSRGQHDDVSNDESTDVSWRGLLDRAMENSTLLAPVSDALRRASSSISTVAWA